MIDEQRSENSNIFEVHLASTLQQGMAYSIAHLPARKANVWPMVLAVQTRVKASGTPNTAPAAQARMLAGNMTTTAMMYRACKCQEKC